MRHGKKIHRLSRPAEHRRALLNNLAAALIAKKQIQTTEAKAKALKPYIDRLISTAKQNTLHSKRLVAQRLVNKVAVKELLNDIVPKLEGRESGFTRVIRYGIRRGDGARLSVIQLLLEEEVERKKKKASKKSSAKPTKAKAEKKAKPETSRQDETETEEEEVKSAEAASETEVTETETEPEDTRVEATEGDTATESEEAAENQESSEETDQEKDK
jgi:large subunit ribosomal protein L17